ncbi:hypothetical protein BT69DRAFT_591141 [Atractiella rhizophila]|nr:hypothetical protein BT69DRAFT_591141 [Atractiella rhizophila]
MAVRGGTGRLDFVIPVPTLLKANNLEMYPSDIVSVTYDCKWMAPTYISDPIGDNLSEVLDGGVFYETGGFFGFGSAPFEPDALYFLTPILKSDSNATSLIPSFDGAIMLAFQTALWYDRSIDGVVFNMSSVPQTAIPSSWRPYQEEWAALQTNIPTDVSVVFCLPRFSIQSYVVAVSSAPLWKTDEPMPRRKGNIDETQLKIAMSDSLRQYAESMPTLFLAEFFFSETITLNSSNSTTIVYYPRDESYLSKRITDLVKGGLTAFFHGAPFGTMVVRGYGYRLGLVLHSQNEFLWVVAVFFLSLAVAGALVLVLQRRERRIQRHLSPSTVLRLVGRGRNPVILGNGLMGTT